jgi:G3E family GTPase
MNPDAVVYETTRSEISPSVVLNTHRFTMDGAEKHEMWLKEARIGEHKPETFEFGIRNFIYRRRKPFHPARFARLMNTPGALPETVLRAKGYTWIASRPQFVAVFEVVGFLRNLRQGHPWWAAMEKDLWPEGLWDDLKPLWNERHGDRAQEVVVIGKFAQQSDIESLLDACLLTDEEMELEVWDFDGDEQLPSWSEHEHQHATETGTSPAFAA